MSAVTKVIERAKALPVRGLDRAGLLLSQLDEVGWQRSLRGQESVDRDGVPVPWWTYAAARWIDLALTKDHRVFEFGSGSSTHWLAQRTASVHSVEHDAAWEAKVRETLPPNATLTFAQHDGLDEDGSDDDAYLAPLRDGSESYDLIVVDGMSRNACSRLAVDHITEGGLILLDDADREAYLPSHRSLTDAGFGRIDFWGPQPGVGHFSTTSLFSRDFDRWTQNLPAPAPSGY